MQLGIDTESFHLLFQNNQMDIFSFIDEAKQLGYQGVMINLVEKKNLTQGLGALGIFEENHVRTVGSYLKERNMFVELADRGTSLKQLRRLFQVADWIGAKTVRTFIQSGNYSHTNLAGSYHSADYITAIKNIKTILPELEKQNLSLCIENHELETGEEIRKLLTQINHPLVGALFDSGNSMMVSEEPIHALEAMLPFIKSTHIKDHIVCKQNGHPFVCGVPLGKGNVDLDSIIKKLCEQTKLSHLILEMCFPYASSFSRIPDSESDLFRKTTFQVRDIPYRDTNYPLENYYTYDGKYLEELIFSQKLAVAESTKKLKSLLKKYDTDTTTLQERRL